MRQYIGALDQGTTSTRFILFDETGSPASWTQVEHKQYYPKPGWVEHDPEEIINNTSRVIRETLQKSGISAGQLAALGITNQRETTVLWDRRTGKPCARALVWQDTRTTEMINRLTADGGANRFRDKTGLPLATYFSASKIAWLLDNVEGLRRSAEKGDVLFGTIDSWLLWNLTGGPKGGVHGIDVTNASRTMLMDLKTLAWDDELLEVFRVPRQILPEILSSVPTEPYGYTDKAGPLGTEVPVAGILGDQQAALFGQACFEPGSSKNTYGTGCFLLQNTGTDLVHSKYGLLTTVAYRRGTEEVVYALEGSIAVAGSLVQWLRDNMGLIQSSSEIETLASSVEDSGGVYFVPAFSGLFAPHWRSDARGVITGLTGYAKAGHVARAVLEATAFQTREIVQAMEKDSGIVSRGMKVDGGMVVNELLMQFQADILDIPVIRPKVTETTALGAAYAAGLTVGFWKDLEELSRHWEEDKHWTSFMSKEIREEKLSLWNKAVERAMGWVSE
ncbi:MAG: glycerol kinase GlpK [Spirochaetales bacterium]|nr:glycerol kinase GlpK [Spirochaetales bacterium]